MHTPAISEQTPSPIRNSLHHEGNELEALHRGWAQHVAAWQLAHQAVAGETEALLARMDALIARLESR
jgi:hypothetical protein